MRYLSVEDEIAIGFRDGSGEKVMVGGKWEWKSIPEGASTQVTAAFDPGLSGKLCKFSSIAKPGLKATPCSPLSVVPQ